jgi:hypothetical protein
MDFEVQIRSGFAALSCEEEACLSFLVFLAVVRLDWLATGAGGMQRGWKCGKRERERERERKRERAPQGEMARDRNAGKKEKQRDLVQMWRKMERKTEGGTERGAETWSDGNRKERRVEMNKHRGKERGRDIKEIYGKGTGQTQGGMLFHAEFKGTPKTQKLK